SMALRRSLSLQVEPAVFAGGVEMPMKLKAFLTRWTSDYGMLLVLLLLCIFFSWRTWGEQQPEGADAGRRLADLIAREHGRAARVVIACQSSQADVEFAAELERRLRADGITVVESVLGQPADARRALERLAGSGISFDLIAGSPASARWPVFESVRADLDAMAAVKVVAPGVYHGSTFLKGSNLLNIANQIVVIAIIAIGMTMVIITAGIDLSVGSLIALSAVVATWLIRASDRGAGFLPRLSWPWLASWIALTAAASGIALLGRRRRAPRLQTAACLVAAGAAIGAAVALWPTLFRTFLDIVERLGPTPAGMIFCCLCAIGVCAAVGAFSGSMVTFFRVPAFIVTLGMMLVASGLAYIIAEGQSIYEIPDSFVWLGRGVVLGRIPIAVLLMAALYTVAHIAMTRMALGRYIYAVGGNPEAARLSGVPVRRIVLLVYTVSGALAGLGGIVVASQLKSGSPTYGLMYELYVIAAVVVGGTSLAGGEGKILGTLIGAFIIAVIQNGMNLTGVESYTQKVVLGLVILGAVLLDRLKKQGGLLLRRKTP
ncbi:MAG: ABC transporter permease, partial [Planctomycetes bacterium]|nr:ABC transporter permease [Planctomycetota bacterium]